MKFTFTDRAAEDGMALSASPGFRDKKLSSKLSSKSY